MIRRYRRYRPVLIFLLLATPLLAGFVMPESAQEILKEKRTRAPAPSLTLDAFAGWPKQADAYLGDRFGLRTQMIRLHANLAKRWLGEGNDLVLVGRHGRLFYLGDVSVQQSAGLVRRDAQVTETADFLATMRDALSQRGARLLVASPPNAATIYQDDLPRWARNNGRSTEYTIFLADLAARGIKAVDLRPAVWAARSKARPIPITTRTGRPAERSPGSTPSPKRTGIPIGASRRMARSSHRCVQAATSRA